MRRSRVENGNQTLDLTLAGKPPPSLFVRVCHILLKTEGALRKEHSTFHPQALSLRHNGTCLAKGPFLVSIKWRGEWIPEEGISVHAMFSGLAEECQEQHRRFSA